MRILQVNTADSGGGAEGSARRLFETYRERGHDSWLAVGVKDSDDPDVFEIPVEPASSAVGRALQAGARLFRRHRKRIRGAQRLARLLDTLAIPERRHNRRDGREDFHFPGSHRVLELPPASPDIVHCHNLHGWYFDLCFLPELSRRVPTILNLRDTWLLTGHCAYFLDCDRWRTGCGDCPHLDVYPALRRDRTAENWQRKRDIYAAGRFFVTAPSQWLLDCAKDSILRAEEYRLIPNGIDLEVFHPGDRAGARRELGIPENARVVMVAAARPSVFKDLPTMTAALRKLDAAKPPVVSLWVLCVGRIAHAPSLHRGTVQALGYLRSPHDMASCYRAADVFFHTARAEAFGKTVAEAMACGTPVVASDVGGLSEQVLEGKTGYCVPVGDAAAAAERLTELLRDDAKRRAFAAPAAARGAEYGLDKQADAFVEWYEEILGRRGSGQTTTGRNKP